MTVETVSALKIVADLTLSIFGQLSKLKDTPKKRLAKTLSSLLEVLKKTDGKAQNVLRYLDALRNAKTETERIQNTHKVREAVSEFGKASSGYIRWIEKQKEFSNALDLIDPNWGKRLFDLYLEDTSVQRKSPWDMDLSERVEHRIIKISHHLDISALKRTRKQFQKIHKLSNDLMLTVRQFAVKNLTIEDLF